MFTYVCMYVCMYILLLAMVTIHAKHCNITETITKEMDGHNDTYSHPSTIRRYLLKS